MLIQANTLQLTYLLYIIINVSNLSAYMFLYSVLTANEIRYDDIYDTCAGGGGGGETLTM